MKAYIANTDHGWYSYLVSQPKLEEVNFWKPHGGVNFKVLSPGEPLIFKLKKAHGNAIVGFGLFVMFRRLPLVDAWQAFGDGNGAASFNDMWTQVARYLKKSKTLELSRNHKIGCILLTTPIFFPKEYWVRGPQDWSQNIVAGKAYDTRHGEGRRIWDECLERLQWLQVEESLQYNLEMVRDVGRYGAGRVVRPRLGQGTFRYAVEQAYQKCAITQEHSLPALEAAHIVPYADGGTHEVNNGLLLRADIHRLYDRGYVTVTTDFRFRVSENLHEEYHNGKVYYQLDGHKIWLPRDEGEWPRQDNLEYHQASIFRG